MRACPGPGLPTLGHWRPCLGAEVRGFGRICLRPPNPSGSTWEDALQWRGRPANHSSQPPLLAGFQGAVDTGQAAWKVTKDEAVCPAGPSQEGPQMSRCPTPCLETGRVLQERGPKRAHHTEICREASPCPQAWRTPGPGPLAQTAHHGQGWLPVVPQRRPGGTGWGSGQGLKDPYPGGRARAPPSALYREAGWMRWKPAQEGPSGQERDVGHWPRAAVGHGAQLGLPLRP